jgi:hypothetical protein
MAEAVDLEADALDAKEVFASPIRSEARGRDLEQRADALADEFWAEVDAVPWTAFPTPPDPVGRAVPHRPN